MRAWLHRVLLRAAGALAPAGPIDVGPDPFDLGSRLPDSVLQYRSEPTAPDDHLAREAQWTVVFSRPHDV